ncbi:hypothetical protein GCM10008967_29850 [Bacillus carboniphilus]|uniref:Chromosome segregation ATPase n=1 Tax=Bacillus carboniphilus TaxID=86663 RepID=A0ABN0WH91_9BACI
MPSISKIRFTNVVYEDGMKRYNDEIFKFDGYNGAILLENGGGKTVFIQTALQAIIPHTSLSDRKIKQTLQLDNYPAHIAIEWILSENPRRYLVTAVSLFLTKDALGSYRYVYPYQAGDRHGIEGIPFVRKESNRPADRGEISDYYQQMSQQFMNAQTFSTIKEFQQHIEEQYHIIANEWESIVKINSTEGGVEAFFDECKQTTQLFDRLLIPTVEGAISGHDQKTFADTFEKHRASFKLYKELKEQIEENKAIEEELDRYVLTYEGLHVQEQAYEQKKQRAKAVLDLILNQQVENKNKLDSIEIKIKDWEVVNRHHLKKKLSVEIQREQDEKEKIQNELNDHSRALHFYNDDLLDANNSFYSLKHAELKHKHKEEQSRIQSLNTQLEMLDEDEEIHEVKDKLDENSQELVGYFLHEMEKSNKRKHELKLEKQPIEEQIQKSRNQLADQSNQLEHTKEKYNSINGEMEKTNQYMTRIKNKILSNPDQESVSDSIKQWEGRLDFLDNQIVQLKNDNKHLTGLINECKEQQETLSNELATKDRDKFQLQGKIDQANSAHEKAKEVLSTLRTQWATLDSIYLKQDSLTKQTHDYILQLNIERDTGLYKERLAHRFIDDYGTQDLFFADPFLEKQVKQWGNQFNLLETGVQFIQSFNVSDRVKQYPLWSITLITTEGEKEHLKRKIKNMDQVLQFPIEVISVEQARAIVQGGKHEPHLITPAYWTENQDITYFQNWKQTMKKRAEEATTARLEIEGRLNDWNRGAEKLLTFLQEYPYKDYQESKESLSELVHRIQELKTKLKDVQTKKDEYEKKHSTQKDRFHSFEQEYYGLQGKMKDAQDYLQLEKEFLDNKKVQEQLTAQIQDYERVIKNINNQISRLEEDKREIEKSEDAENYHYTRLIDDELYHEVKAFHPIYTNKTKSILIKEREELNYALRKLSSTRNEIKIKLEHSYKELNNIANQLEEIVLDHGPIKDEIVFPPNGKERIAYFREKINDLKKSVDEATKEYRASEEKKIKQEKDLEFAFNKFYESFPNEEPEIFVEPVKEIQEQLVVERKRLDEQLGYHEEEQKRISKEYESLRDAFHELDRFEEAHHFKGPSVIASVLTDEEIQNFTYERLAFVQNVTVQLKQGKDKVSKEYEKVDKAKESFKSFCKNKITNVKMREMARQGIDHKKSYKEVIEFQTNMQKRIQNAIKYNEESIINHDKQLEQYVTHINSHLRTIAGELELIPKKTKVKIENSWKEIFKFSIPEWTEEEGKNRIRKHIEWILEQLDSERFTTVEGKEDYAKVRKEIETWLHSKQLLRVVMNNEIMKVSCRKVTNDNQVTTRSYSWEQSNVWSGGEKWSKNMTLFLGILNYVAEKQKHIEANMKRHRVVIMDNPFGKASSDHVLNPVFFIAEQLGFQIIALTAHAEGKFLRDYFPVIYSCRLRKAADSNKQIMTKVKQIHQAYFQDHEPQALERLGEVEQLELF